MAGKAHDEAAELVDDLREKKIEHLEQLREITGLSMEEVSNWLGETKSWYSNKKRGTQGHEFSRVEYELVKQFLELECLRQATWISERDINNRFSKGGGYDGLGWYKFQVRNGFNLTEYERLRSFLELVVVWGHQEGYRQMENIDELVEVGILAADVVNDGK